MKIKPTTTRRAELAAATHNHAVLEAIGQIERLLDDATANGESSTLSLPLPMQTARIVAANYRDNGYFSRIYHSRQRRGDTARVHVAIPKD